MNPSISIPERVKQAVQSIVPDATVILFGSRARGDFHAASDWDFLILLEKIDDETKGKIRHELYKLELETEEVISSLIEEKAEWERHQILLLYQNVNKEGVLIDWHELF